MPDTPETNSEMRARLLDEQLQKVEATFTRYATLHAAKGTPESAEKAQANVDMAGVAASARILANDQRKRINALEAFVADVLREGTYKVHLTGQEPYNERTPLAKHAAALLGMEEETK
jgi:hypothetical protein